MRRCAARRSGRTPCCSALCVFALILAASVLYTKVYSARGAFLHVGAFVGTIMAFNVFMVIIPNQRKMVAQLLHGRDARRALRRRSASSARPTTTT